MRSGYMQKSIKNLDITCQESHLLYLMLRIIFQQKKKKFISSLQVCFSSGFVLL